MKKIFSSLCIAAFALLGSAFQGTPPGGYVLNCRCDAGIYPNVFYADCVGSVGIVMQSWPGFCASVDCGAGYPCTFQGRMWARASQGCVDPVPFLFVGNGVAESSIGAVDVTINAALGCESTTTFQIYGGTNLELVSQVQLVCQDCFGVPPV